MDINQVSSVGGINDPSLNSSNLPWADDVKNYYIELEELKNKFSGNPNSSDPLERLGLMGCLKALQSGSIPSGCSAHELSAWVLATLNDLSENFTNPNAANKPAWVQLQDDMLKNGWTVDQIFGNTPSDVTHSIIGRSYSGGIGYDIPPIMGRVNILIQRINGQYGLPNVYDGAAVQKDCGDPNWTLSSTDINNIFTTITSAEAYEGHGSTYRNAITDQFQDNQEALLTWFQDNHISVPIVPE